MFLTLNGQIFLSCNENLGKQAWNGLHLVEKRMGKKKTRLSSTACRPQQPQRRCRASTRRHRCRRPPLHGGKRRQTAASFDCGLKCWSVCRMNECSWCQPRPITRYSTLTQCLLLLASGCCRKRRRGATNDTALSFLCAFYSGLGWSSDIKSSSLLRLDY